MKQTLKGILVTALALLPMTAVKAQTVRALIVTVGKYKDADVPSFIPEKLGSEQRDSEYIQIALKSVLKKPIEITELSTDKGVSPERVATHDNVLRALAKLQKEARAGDTVIVYFSGHGSRQGNHFSLCPYDASPSADDNDITDVALANWIQPLAAKTANITLILDCCFNEYPTKDPVHRAKFLRRGNGVDLEPMKWEFPLNSAVVLKASRNDEEAQQKDETGTGKWVGVFTHQLCLELIKPNADKLTYAQLMQKVNDDVKNEIQGAFHNSFSQTPQLEGSPAQQGRRLFQAPVNGGAALPVLPPHLDVSKRDDGKLDLPAGRRQNVTVGSVYDVYPPDAPRLDHPTGKIRVTEVQDNRATAEVVDGQIAPSGSRVVEQIHREPGGALQSRFACAWTRPVRQKQNWKRLCAAQAW